MSGVGKPWVSAGAAKVPANDHVKLKRKGAGAEMLEQRPKHNSPGSITSDIEEEE